MKHDKKNDVKQAPPRHEPAVLPSEAETPRPLPLPIPQPIPPNPAFVPHRTTVETDGARTHFLVCLDGCGRMPIVGPQATLVDQGALDELAFRSRGRKVQHGPGHV